jgi:PKD repeat protein
VFHASLCPLGHGGYIEDGNNSVTISVLEGTTSINGNLTKTVLFTGGEDSGSTMNYTNDAYGIIKYKEFTPNVFIEGVGFEDITVTYNPPRKLANTTATIGEVVNNSGVFDYTLSSFGTYQLNYDVTSKFVKFENITVPAGSFLTLKVQEFITIDGYINGQYLSQTATYVDWYAKYIGQVKSISTKDGIQTTTELVSINFQPFLKSDFSVSQVSGVAPHSLNFTDQSDGNILTWLWSFGDGTTSTLQNPSHTYNTPGTYTVSLSVSGLGGSDERIKTGYIRVALAGGDINNDKKIDMKDIDLVLQVLTGRQAPQIPLKIPDINGDNKIGVESLVYFTFYFRP